MEEIDIEAGRRVETGKCPSRRLRKAGRIPAVLYGSGVDGAVSLALDAKRLEKVLHTGAGENVLVKLKIEGSKGIATVMFKEVTRHPLEDTLQHVDMMEVAMDRTITVDIPIHIVGKAEGVTLGGILQQEARTIRIECLPGQIPDSIDADVTTLGIGKSLHVSDLVFPEGIAPSDDPKTTIVSIAAPVTEVEEKTPEEMAEELTKSFEEKGEEGKEETKEESKE